MSDLESRFHRLLKWYPSAWRSSHGDALIGTLLDAADAEGRTRPTGAEARSMRAHGFGERFTLRAALFSASSALIMSFAGLLALFVGIDSVAQFGGGWIPLALNLFGASTLATVAVLALLRHWRLLRADRMLPALLLAISAWTCAFLAAWSWSVGFDEADAGLARSSFSPAFAPLLLTAWILGGLMIAIVVLDSGRSLPAGIRWAAAVAGAVACPPLIGLAAYSPFVGMLVALMLTVMISALIARQGSVWLPSTTSGPARAIDARLRRGAGVIALSCAVVGTACALFALLGGILSPAIDPTRAMQLGLGAGALSGVPLLLMAGRLLTSRRPNQVALWWCGMLLIAGAVVAHAVGAIGGMFVSGDIPWLAVIPLAIGIGLVAWAFVRATPLLRGMLAAAVMVTALFPGWGLLVAAGFLAPAAAYALAAWGLRTGRRTTSNSTQVA